MKQQGALGSEETGRRARDSWVWAPMTAGVGADVMLRDLDSGGVECFRLVHEGEANPKRGLLSIQSPLGASLLGREEGSRFSVTTPTGRRAFEIIDVENLRAAG